MRFVSKILIILVSFFILPVSVQGYSPDTTHRALTQEIVNFYNQIHSDKKISERQKYWMMEGSRLEDEWPRWWFHFYDPVNNIAFNGENLGSVSPQVFNNFSKIAISSDDPQPAIRWATDEKLQQRYRRYGGDRTWDKALEYYRQGNKKEAFITLGHILHLLQDMGVPDHTRNDPHPPLNESHGFFAEEFGQAIGEDGSPYELYTKQFSPKNIKKSFDIVSSLLEKQSKPPGYENILNYLKDTAEYSNKYFFSKDTVLSNKYDEPKIVKEEDGYGYSYDENGQLFRSLKIVKSLNENKEYIKIYKLRPTEDYYSILNTYFQKLSKEIVLNGAGVVELFYREVGDRSEDNNQNKVLGYNFDNFPGSSIIGRVFSPASEIAKLSNKASSFFGNIGSVIGDTFSGDEPGEFVEEIDITSDEPEETDSVSKNTSENSVSNINLANNSSNQKQLNSCDLDFNKNPLRENVIINEVAWMGSGNNFRDEWVEFKNVSSKTIDLGGYRVVDESKQIDVEVPNGSYVAPGGFYLISRTNSLSNLDFIYSGSLSNTEESLYLFNSDCQVEDFVEASPDWPSGENESKRTMERKPDLSWQTSLFVGGTPGQKNSEGIAEEKENKSENSNILSEFNKDDNEDGNNTSNNSSDDDNSLANDRSEKDTEEVNQYPECRYSDGNYPYQNGLIINEVAWMGSGESHYDEWIELKNISNSFINLDGYQIVDKSNQIHKIFKDKNLRPGEYLLLERSNDDTVPAINADFIFHGSIGNNSEGLKLYDNRCGLVDSVESNSDWPAGKNSSNGKYTMVRSNDLSWYDSRFPGGTPGSQNRFIVNDDTSEEDNDNSNDNEDNDSNSNDDTENNTNENNSDNESDTNQDTVNENPSDLVGQVLISEVMAGAGTGISDQEFVELYNPTDSDIDLTGWSLERKISSSRENTQILVDSFGADYIRSNQYFLIASKEYVGTLPDQVYNSDNHLAYEDDVVILKDNKGEVVDRISYLSASRGSSFERYASVEGDCVTPDESYEYSGNGCVDSKFSIRQSPDPQNSKSLPEPRTGPATSGNKFSAVYNPDSLNIEFEWDPYADFSGSFDGFTYKIEEYDGNSSKVIYASSSAWFNKNVEEVGKDYNFRFQAVDSDGMKSEKATTAITVPKFLDNIDFYEDTRLNGTNKYLIDLNYESYPFIPNIYKANWKAIVFYLNSPPKKQINLDSNNNWIPEDTSNVLPVVYENCAGSESANYSLILADTSDSCDSVGGGLITRPLDFDNLLEDNKITLKTSFSQDDVELNSDDYITTAYYSFYKSGGGMQNFKLAAVDVNEYNFDGLNHDTISPVLLGEPSVAFDNNTSILSVDWDSASDEDSIDSDLEYEINFSPITNIDGDLWENIGSNLSYDKHVVSGDEFMIGVRAKDEFGNYSNIATTTWEYPPAQFYISQEFSDDWSDKWGFVNHSLGEPDVASFQSFAPEKNFSFNKVSVKVWQQETEVDGSSAQSTNLRMSVYSDDGSNNPDFKNKIAETDSGGKILPKKGDIVSFNFDNDISVSLGNKYWLVLDVKSTHRDSWFDGRWHNAIATGGSVYDEGEAGEGYGKGKNSDSDCVDECSFEGSYGSRPSDWWFKIGWE